MPQRKFANQKALIDYAEQNGLVYVWAWIERQRVISPAFTKRCLVPWIFHRSAPTATRLRK
jgi:hypothetical protein